MNLYVFLSECKLNLLISTGKHCIQTMSEPKESKLDCKTKSDQMTTSKQEE